MRLLLIEDDLDLCHALSYQLKLEQFEVDCCHDGSSADLYINQNIYDLILLDRMLPGEDGIAILRRMRARGNQTPVIILSALGEVANRVQGLEIGADDYLVKPFAFEELLARMHCIFRRPAALKMSGPLQYADLCLFTETHQLTCGTKSCPLSVTETRLMEYFMKSGGHALERTQLLCRIWGNDSEITSGNLDNYVYFLRKRLRTIGSTASIRTIRGIGFCLEGNS